MRKLRTAAVVAAVLLSIGTVSAVGTAQAKNENKPAQKNGQGQKNVQSQKKADGKAADKKRPAAAQAPLLKAAWEISKQEAEVSGAAVQTADGLFFYESDGSLRAADAATGKLRWSYAGGTLPSASANASVFLIEENERITKLDSQKGKKRWSTELGHTAEASETSLRVLQGSLYYSDSSGRLAAYHTGNGKLKWENDEIQSETLQVLGRYGDVLAAEGTTPAGDRILYGVYAETGSLLWQIEGSYEVLGTQDDKLILRDLSATAAFSADEEEDEEDSAADIQQDSDNELDNPQEESEESAAADYLITLVHADLKSGKLTQAGQYAPLESSAIDLQNSRTFLQGSVGYSVDETEDGLRLTRFSMSQGKYADAAKSYANAGDWIGGPEQGWAFFQKETGLTGVKLANGVSVTFGDPGSKAAIAPVVSGQLVYIGLENGEIHAFNLKTGTPIGRLAAGSGDIQSISATKSGLLIRTDTKWLGLTLAKSSK
ncbi:PQQ-binding-like beta-propeller repeat protein [Saccharibacillus deserti]|uniref:outer membrane protein assembly factor BamB family protein n=1 Tax=Saccharibacillus deserti TaxID=1634444 RepID=UPI001554230E|nr:PQQ-binding-like beta-propeller repeat protein [Saccharibacillus deserti]